MEIVTFIDNDGTAKPAIITGQAELETLLTVFTNNPDQPVEVRNAIQHGDTYTTRAYAEKKAESDRIYDRLRIARERGLLVDKALDLLNKPAEVSA